MRLVSLLRRAVSDKERGLGLSEAEMTTRRFHFLRMWRGAMPGARPERP